MNRVTLGDLCKGKGKIEFLSYVRNGQKPSNAAFSSIENPKKQNMILYVENCSTHYVNKNKTELFTEDGNMVYVPMGAEYTVKCLSCVYPAGSTLQINFNILDEDGNKSVFTDKITAFSVKSAKIKTLFEKAEMLSENASSLPAEYVAVLYELFSAIAKGEENKKVPTSIEKGVNYLNSRYAENPSVVTLAEECGVTPEYFRKLFKQYFGKTPLQYKNDLRLKKAEEYLEYSDIPISELSEKLGYLTVSHFIKTFKDANGISPLAYRNGKISKNPVN